jgi:hypothetical protein
MPSSAHQKAMRIQYVCVIEEHVLFRVRQSRLALPAFREARTKFFELLRRAWAQEIRDLPCILRAKKQAPRPIFVE